MCGLTLKVFVQLDPWKIRTTVDFKIHHTCILFFYSLTRHQLLVEEGRFSQCMVITWVHQSQISRTGESQLQARHVTCSVKDTSQQQGNTCHAFFRTTNKYCKFSNKGALLIRMKPLPPLSNFYRPRSEGDNALGSVRLFVCLFVCLSVCLCSPVWTVRPTTLIFGM